jgi:CheY-like chemotaxis protein
MVAREVLEQAGASVRAVDCGQGALDAVSGAAQRPDVILMDLQMPELDGFETTRRLRAAEQASGDDPVRIVGLSANALSDTPARCIEAGMDDYISKPVDIPRLIACLKLNGGKRVEPEPAVAGTMWSDTRAWGETLPGVDLGELSKRFGGSRETVTRLFRFLLEEHTDAFDQFEQQCQSGDRAAAAALLHDLVGLAASLAAHRVLAETRSLQSALRRGEVTPQERAALGRAFAELIDSARQFSAGQVQAGSNAGLSH